MAVALLPATVSYDRRQLANLGQLWIPQSILLRLI